MPAMKLSELSREELEVRWDVWIRRIYGETIGLHWNRRMFRMMREIAKDNHRLQMTGSYALDWMFENYVVAAAMTFRRELDKQAGTENLRNLLFEIVKRPDVLSRARHRKLWGPATFEV